MPNAVTNQSVRSIVIPLFFLFVITLLFITISPLVHSPVSPYNLNQRLGSIPLFFEENLGQLGKDIKFSTRGKGYTAYFSESGVKFFINTVKENSHSSFEMRLVDATETQFISPQNSLPGKSHFYTGRNQDSWHVNVPHYSKLKYSQVYPGIDLVFYGNRNRLEFDFVVQPGVSPDMVAFEFNGAESVDIGQNGDLLVKVGNEAFTFHRPKIYQECYGEKRPVEGCYSETENGSIGFIVESYDPQFALIIDPTLTYSTYVGGNELDQTKGVAKDDEGNIYIAGFSRSSILPQDNPNPPTSTSDLYGFVLKFDPAGTNLLYAVYLDGQDIEACLDLAVDGEGNAFVTGYTKSSDFPVQNAWQDKLIGPRDAFIAKLGPDGSELLFSTFLGGAGGWDHDYRLLEWRGNDQGNAIAIDESGNAYIAGETDAIDFPVTETAWDTSGGVIELTYTSTSYHDGFAARFSPEGGLIYSTFIGGDEEEDMEWRETASDDYCHGICVDVNGYAYITGRTDSYHFPTTENAVQKSNAGWSDVFVVKLNPDGSDAVYSTYLGGNKWDDGLAITVDLDGRAYVTGTTLSADFPAKNAFQPEYGGHPDIDLYWFYGGDAFVSVLNASGSNLEYSTYIGGEEREKGWGIAVDDSSNAFVTGYTYSHEFPKLSSLNSDIIGNMDAFITKLNAVGDPVYSTLIGGQDKTLYGDNFYTEMGAAVFVDDLYNVYVTGRTNAADFPTLNAYQDELEGSVREGNQPFTDIFIAKLGSEMRMIPDGVAYDPENWDTHVGELQSTFSDLKISGAGLDDVSEIVFKLKNEPDDYLIPQNINATATEVTFDLVVAHAAELGERDIILKMDDGSEIDVTKMIGKKFIVSRVLTFYNQAVNQNSLDTHEYRDILVANKRGVARLVLDDEDQYNHTFTGKLKVKGIAGDCSSIRPYEYRDSYSEQELIDARDDMIIPIPGPPGEGEHTLSVTLDRDDGKIFYCPDIKREFYQSASINVLFLRYKIGFADGQRLNGAIPSVDAADLPGAANYVRKLYPISQDQLTYRDYGDPVLPQQFSTKTVQSGANSIVVLEDTGTLIDLLLYLDDYLDDANRLMGGNFNVIVAFLPGASLYEDNNNDNDVNDSVDSWTTGCTLDGTRAVIVTPSNYDDQWKPQNLGSTLAHELGHRILDIALETAELVPGYGENLGDEYKGGSFHTGVNPPILGNVDRNNNVCENSPFIFGVNGDSSAIYTDRSAFDTWHMEPKLTYLGEQVSAIRHNFMGNSRADSVLWTSLRCYNELMKSLVPNVDLGLQKSFSMDPVLRITGMVKQDGFGEITSVVEKNTGVPSPVSDGPFTIEVCDAVGTTLASNSFGSLFVLNTNPPENLEDAPFSIRMSKVSGAKKIILKKDGLELDSFVLSDHAPTIEIQSPNTGDEIKKSTVISWAANDPDGDELTYSVLYRVEDDRVLPVASGLSSTSYTLETELFDHASGSITVIASDGYHRSSDRVSDITVGVSVDPLNTSPNRYQLGQNYPNPFNDGTTIQYVVPKVGKAVPVRIDIYNTLGEIIHTLVNKSQNPGTYSITWNGDYKNGKIAPTGVYFYRLQVGGNEQVKKMLKMQ